MIAQHLGHVVFYVRDLNRSLTFYRDLLRFDEVGKIGDHVSELTSVRTNHEIFLIEVGDAPGPMQGKRIGLFHIGIKIGNTLNELRLVRDELIEHGIQIDGASDHTVTQSLYVRDPDGNEVELYVDADPKIWKDDPSKIVSPIKPLDL